MKLTAASMPDKARISDGSDVDEEMFTCWEVRKEFFSLPCLTELGYLSFQRASSNASAQGGKKRFQKSARLWLRSLHACMPLPDYIQVNGWAPQSELRYYYSRSAFLSTLLFLSRGA